MQIHIFACVLSAAFVGCDCCVAAAVVERQLVGPQLQRRQFGADAHICRSILRQTDTAGAIEFSVVVSST